MTKILQIISSPRGVASYLKTMLGFLGMTDVTVERVEGASAADAAPAALANAMARISF